MDVLVILLSYLLVMNLIGFLSMGIDKLVFLIWITCYINFTSDAGFLLAPASNTI